MLKKIIILFLVVISSLFSKVIEFDTNATNIALLKNSFIYIDDDSNLTFEQVRAKKFDKYTSDKLHLGLTTATVWVKFSIKNSSNKYQNRYIVLDNPQHDSVELYIKQIDGSFLKQVRGLKQLDFYTKDNLLNPSFQISFQPNEQKEFYLKAHSLTSANFFQLFLRNSKEVYKEEFLHQIIEAFFFGTIFALLIYNIFIFIFTKELSYLYYVVFIFGATINYLSYSIMTYYFFGDNQFLYDIDAFLGPFYILVSNIFVLLFIDRILQIKQFLYLHTINKLLVLISILLIIVSVVYEYLLEFAMLYSLLSVFYILILIVFAFYKKIEFSRYILIGWSISIVGLFSLGFVQYDIWSPIDIFPYFYELSVFLEAVIFSTVLASRLNKTKELENAVKTNELLTKELHHRVKNNMQFIILMYRLKFANLSDQKIDEKLSEVEGAVQAIAKTYEILYQHDKLNLLDTKNYFNNLIEEIKKGFVAKDIKIASDITTLLNPQNAIYCGIILNELITNSLKYAFKNNKGKIQIGLKKEDDKYIFSVVDNGVGFDNDKNTLETFGLEFIKNIVQDKLHGDIEINSKDKTAVTITFE